MLKFNVKSTFLKLIIIISICYLLKYLKELEALTNIKIQTLSLITNSTFLRVIIMATINGTTRLI
jgi:hypothetical protein